MINYTHLCSQFTNPPKANRRSTRFRLLLHIPARSPSTETKALCAHFQQPPSCASANICSLERKRNSRGPPNLFSLGLSVSAYDVQNGRQSPLPCGVSQWVAEHSGTVYKSPKSCRTVLLDLTIIVDNISRPLVKVVFNLAIFSVCPSYFLCGFHVRILSLLIFQHAT